MVKIAAGLERAFALHGFAEPNVDLLRDAAGVSLRTLYKYTPSRDDMVRAALEHRHTRYMAHLFAQTPATPADLLDRIATWMQVEASHGCLFHSAVASAPQDQTLRALLDRHKSEVAAKAAEVTGYIGDGATLLMIFEGLTQCWPLERERAVETARRLVDLLPDPDRD